MLLIFFTIKIFFLQKWDIIKYTILWEYMVTIFSSY